MRNAPTGPDTWPIPSAHVQTVKISACDSATNGKVTLCVCPNCVDNNLIRGEPPEEKKRSVYTWREPDPAEFKRELRRRQMELARKAR
jgi:hypothetical protein